MSKKIAVVLAGCGNQDGAEITESASALIALSEAGVQVQIFAPDVGFKAKDFLTGKVTGEERNVLLEAARIARGDIKPLSELMASDFDGVVFPGGFGVALHLCTWAEKGSKCEVLPDAERVIRDFYSAQKPICAICIAPALIGRVLGSEGVTLTLGRSDDGGELAKTGAHFEACAVTDFVTDREHRVISTPAYMYGEARPFEVFTGIRKAVRELVEMA